ncbi:MAG: hypothetical protein AB1921_19295 [Thermodesulfobacteriota bacterium]
MKLWSRGLGTTEITMDFRSYQVVKDPETGNIHIIGTMKDPVNWEFRITVEPDDIPGFLKVAANLSILAMGLKNAYKFINFLLHRQEYEGDDPKELEKKVNAAYDQMMRRNRPRRPSAGA